MFSEKTTSGLSRQTRNAEDYFAEELEIDLQRNWGEPLTSTQKNEEKRIEPRWSIHDRVETRVKLDTHEEVVPGSTSSVVETPPRFSTTELFRQRVEQYEIANVDDIEMMDQTETEFNIGFRYEI